MDTETRRKIGGMAGEFLVIEKQRRLAESSVRTFVTDYLQKNEPVEFRPSQYWDDRMKENADSEDALASALMDESEAVVFDRISEDDPTDGRGYLTSLAWDKDAGDVVASIYIIAEKKTERVTLGNVKSVFEILRFFDTFA